MQDAIMQDVSYARILNFLVKFIQDSFKQIIFLQHIFDGEGSKQSPSPLSNNWSVTPLVSSLFVVPISSIDKKTSVSFSFIKEFML